MNIIDPLLTLEQNLEDLIAEFEETPEDEDIEEENVRNWFGPPANDNDQRSAA